MPPDILDYPSSSDMVVPEGSNVSLRCEASGSPAPNITWRRDNNELISLGNGLEGEFYLFAFAPFIMFKIFRNYGQYLVEYSNF